MNIQKFDDVSQAESRYTAMLYCPPGVGKSTAIGLIAEASNGNTLVLDVDRTISKTLAKKEVVKDTSKLFIAPIEIRAKNAEQEIVGTFESWQKMLRNELTPEFLAENDIRTIAVDNISELERCILSDLGAQGKNKGVPSQSDYQYMQFQLVNSLRYMKGLGVNIVWTAWQDVRAIVNFDGTQYSQLIPKISQKIVDNICGLCDVVGNIIVNKEGARGVILEATRTIYAKNQIDSRKVCKVEDFVKFAYLKDEEKAEEDK